MYFHEFINVSKHIIIRMRVQLLLYHVRVHKHYIYIISKFTYISICIFVHIFFCILMYDVHAMHIKAIYTLYRPTLEACLTAFPQLRK